MFRMSRKNGTITTQIWAHSSFGRAHPWHGRGGEFDSRWVHQINEIVPISWTKLNEI